MKPMAEKIEVKKIKAKLPVKLNERNKKVLIVLLALLILAFLLFNFKHFFIAAVVNNRPITRFALDRELEKQGGQQVLESLITKSLILQEAKKQGVNISEERIKAKLSEIEAQIVSQGSDLDTVLQTQGLTRQSFEEQIRIELIIEEILGKEITISEEEIQNYFEENKELLGDDVTYEEVKNQLKEDLRQQELGTKFQSWVMELEQKAKIYYLLKF